MMKYKVLQLDDQWENFSDLVEMFDDEGIELLQSADYPDFETQLLAQKDEIMAVILDVLNFDLEASDFSKAKSLAEHYSISVFPFSGQPDVLGNKTFLTTISKCYSKTDDIDELIEDVKKEVFSKNRNLNYVVDLYPQIYRHLDTLGNSQVNKIVSNYLRSYHFFEDRDLRPDSNKLRFISEALFTYLRENGLLPEECFTKKDNRPNQSDILRYLNGKATEYSFGCATKLFGVIDEEGPILPDDLSNELNKIMHISNIGAHFQGNENLIASFDECMHQSCFLSLCSILIYCTDYVETHNDPEINLSRCYRLSNIINDGGCVELDSDGNHYIDRCLVEEPVETQWNKYKLVRNTSDQTSGSYPFLLRKKKK